MAKKEIKDENGKGYTTKEKKPFYKKMWFKIIAGLVVLGVIFGPKDDNDKKNTESDTTTPVESAEVKEDDTNKQEVTETKEEEKKEPYAITADMTDKEKVENIIKSVVGDGYEGSEIEEKEGGIGQISVTTYVPSGSVWSANSLISTQNQRVMTLLQKLKDNNINHSYLTFTILSDLQDTYGNSNKEEVMHIYLPASETDKINYANFNTENLSKLADEYYIHPALK